MNGRQRWFLRLGVAVPVTAAALAAAVALLDTDGGQPKNRPPGGVGCDRYASPTAAGGDGTRARPFGSFRRLVASLRAGQVGCLAAGRFRHRGVVKLRRPGVTVRPVGRSRSAIDGAIWVMPGARGARIAGLSLVSHDPEFTIPLKIQADRVTVVGNRITTSTSISCVLIGSSRVVRGTLIERNQIRRCGRKGKHDHLIYVQRSRDAVIRNNLLVDNAGGWAVHLYPDADDTVIERNVIDGNKGGVIFAGAFGDTSDGNIVRENVITFSSPRFNIESSWSGEPPGVGNRVYRNCLFRAGPGAPSGVSREAGFEEAENVVAPAAVYVDPRGGDFRVRSDTRCAPLVGNAGRLAALRLRG